NIEECVIDGGAQFGWYTNFMGSVSININECNFLNMGSANLWNQSSGSIDAERNWWGDTDPSDNVNGSNIDYTPWYLDSDRSPMIISATLAADNSYLDLEMIEGCYSTDAGSGDLAASDFQVSNFAANGGGCSGVSINTVTHTAGNTTVRCNLSSTGFASGVETFEIIPATASSVYDEDGNCMSVSQTSGTQTLNSQRPILTDLSVNSTNTSATLTFNQAVYANSNSTGDLQNSDFSVTVSGGNATLGSSDVSHTAGSTTAVFTLTLNGTANGAETITIEPADASSIYNSGGGAMLASQTISDDLNDLLAPTATDYDPEDNLTGVGLGADLELTFSENVQAGSGNIVIKQTSDNGIFESIAAGSGQISYSTNTVTINPSSNLDPSTGYYVNIDNGAIEDLNSNAYLGISGNSTWNFTTMGHPVQNLTQMTNHLTIQDAVDNASAGDVISCVAETYEEQVVIDIDLTLQGSGSSDCVIRAPASLTTADIDGTAYGYAVLANPTSGTINVKLTGFHIDANEQYSTTSRFSGIIFNDVYDDTFEAGIYNCLVDNMGSGVNNAGITVFGESKLTVDNNTIEDYSHRALAYYSDSVVANALVKFTNNTVTGTLSKSKSGFYVIRTDNFVISGNTISNCNETSAGALWIWGCSDGTISGNTISDSYYGIAIYEGSDGNEISNNSCTDCSYSGALISDSDNNDFNSNNIISTIDVPCGVQFVGDSAGNTLDQNTFTLPYSGSEMLRCIQVNGTAGANNVLSNNTLTGGRRGIQVDGSFTGPLTISGNTIQNNGVDSGVKAGLWVDGGEFIVSDNTFSGVVRNIEISGYVIMDIKGNTIDPDGGAAYELINVGSGTSTSSDIEINYNNFENFSCSVINNRASGLSVDFENNWYDGSLPASYIVGDGTTDYTPWLTGAVTTWGMVDDGIATEIGESDAEMTVTLTGAGSSNYLEGYVYGSKTALLQKFTGERYPDGFNSRTAVVWGCEETGSVTGDLDFDMTGIIGITTLGNSILMCRDDAVDSSWESVAGATRNSSVWSVTGVTAFKEYTIGYDKAFNYAGLVNDTNTNTISVSILSVDDVSGQVSCGGGVSGAPNQLTWYWGDGETSSSFFNASHTYSNTSLNYLGEVVASWNDGTPSVSAEFVIRFNNIVITSPITIPTNLTVTIPSSSTFLSNARLGSGSTSYDPFGSSYFTDNTITRTNIEYVLGVAAVTEKELANNDIISISPPGFNSGFPHVLLRNGDAGTGMSSLWYTDPIAFIAGDDAIDGSSISWSSFFHEMGHNFTLNSPADYWFGGKTDGNANAILSETLAQVFAHAAGYEIVNGDYGFDVALKDEIRSSLESSFMTLKSGAADYDSFCSWNDPSTTGVDETLETFMKLAYK
ncbi:MAG: Ig-like domain-containing protein, partial [Candidatus Stygibacter australis]|nr:Ig-like domain-containing protein [Candidatus Stygibacter australis]